jgi:hypothetical protein
MLSWAVACACCLGSFAVGAADQGKLGLRQDDLGFPSATRVTVTLIIAVALIVGATYAVRRWLPGLVSRLPVAGRIRLLESRRISRGLTLHLVEVDGGRLIVTEGRAEVRTLSAPGVADASGGTARAPV